MQKICLYFTISNTITLYIMLLITRNKIAKRRFFFFLKDFIKFHIHFIERIDDLFIIRLSAIEITHLFLKLAIIQEKKIVDLILKVSIFEMCAHDCIIDFSVIDFSRLYLIFIKADKNREIRLR